MKNKSSHTNSSFSKEILDLIENRKKLQKEKEENRKRLMTKQLLNVIGNNKIVITNNLK